MATQGEDNSLLLEGCPADNSPATASDAASSSDDAMDEQPVGIPLDKRLSELTLREWLAAMELYREYSQVPATTPGDEERLLFDFNHINKKEIYTYIIAIMQLQGFRSSNAQVIRFLARYTNLGSEHSIHALLYEYKKTVY